ncbi:MAG: type II toxin-antitoxin system RelE/ParE family toxin [Candidatus Thermoplasmatota archaeon]
MTYEILLTEQAVEDLRKLDDNIEERVRKKIKQLSDYPEHYGKPLKGPKNLWVLKIGRSDWRVIFRIDEEQDEIIIITIGHRRNIYNDFP